MLKVAIVGCGKIADDHAAQIKRIPGCEIVGVCDAEPLMARRAALRSLLRQTCAASAKHCRYRRDA